MKLLLKVILAGLSALLTWQLILMNTVIDTPGTYVHPVLGRIYKSGDNVRGTEGYSRTTINSLGMREEEVQEKKTNEFRVLALGDSYTEAFQVPDDKMYTTLLENDLREMNENHGTVNVLNAGRSGASPAFYIHLSEFYKSKFNPEITIIQLNEGDFTKDIFNHQANFYVVHEGNQYKTQMKEDFTSANPLSQWVKQKFPQASSLIETSVLMVSADKFQKIFLAPSTKKDDLDEVMADSVDESLIAWVLQELKNRYPNLLVIYIPTIDYNDIGKDPSDIEDKLSHYADLINIPLFNMREDFIRSYLNTKQPPSGFNNTTPGKGHINKVGHFLVAERIKTFFEGRPIN